jgi:TRAP-type transport system periplasmic protein
VIKNYKEPIMKSRPIAIFISLIAIFFTVSVVQGSPLIIKLAHEEPGDASRSSAHASALVFKNVLEAESNGQMQVKIYPASSQGNQRDRMELTKAGILHVNIASIGGLAQFYPPINAIDLPFAFPNHAVAYKVFDGPFGQRLRDDLSEKTDLQLLTITAGGFYVLSNNKRPIHNVKDMKGLKFRTMSVPSHIAMMEALGAAATPVPWDELYSSLQTGVVQGQHNPIPIMAIGNLQEVQKYATLTNHLYGADWWVTSNSFYNALTKEQKKIFTNGVTAATVTGRGSKLLLNASDQGIGFLIDAGIEVYSPSPAELAEFKTTAIPAVMKTIEKDLGKEGTELAKAMLAAVDEATSELYK